MVAGKAELVREDYCDGLGACLPVCPTGAITIEEKATAPSSAAVDRQPTVTAEPESLACGCPGTSLQQFKRSQANEVSEKGRVDSRLNQWPIQIKLVPTKAPYFDQAHILIAADCTAFAYGNFHNDYIKNKITLIGCPKLDEGDYSEKLRDIIKNNAIKSVTVVRMEVPCCGGLENAVKLALISSEKMLPWQVVTISTKGEILE